MALRNTGYKGFSRLRERNITTGQLTGVTKVNVDTDPDYIAPVYDPAYCEVGELYVTPEATTYNRTSAAGSININILSNTTWEGTNNAFNISFPFGNTGIHDGVLTVSITENTGSTSKTSSFVLKSTDGSISKVINIVQAGVTPPPPTTTLFKVSLAKAFNQSDACSASVTQSYYMDKSDLGLANNLYTNSAGTTKATAGYYSDGELVRYWSGSTFSGKGSFCQF